MDKASCLSNHVVSGDRRKGEIDEDARGVYLVWLDGNGMRDVGGGGGGGGWCEACFPYSTK
jgi:hypothetical protein